MTPLSHLARLAETIAGTASRLSKRAAIVDALKPLHARGADHDAGLFCQYLAGMPFSEADPRKLNAGGALLSRALKTVSGATDAALTAAYRRHGDMGSAAYDVLAPPYGHAPTDATVMLDDVAAAFDGMATARTTAARSETVETLLRRSTALEAKYLLKLMLGDMRIGVKQSLVEEAIAVAANADVAAVRHAVMLEADLSRAVARAFDGKLTEARMTLFHPLGFMLASPVETPDEAVARFTAPPPKPPKPVKKSTRKRKKSTGDAGEDRFPDLSTLDAVAPWNVSDDSYASTVEAVAAEEPPVSAHEAGPLAFIEDKYDGMRVQLHCGDPSQPGRVALYSRNREDVTVSFPEIAEAFTQVSEPLMLDGELLGWDPAAQRALPFALLGQRIGRKRVDDDMRRAVPVVFMAFDVLFDRGQLLLDRPLEERRARLEARVMGLQPHTSAPLAGPRPQSEQSSLFASSAEPADTLQRLQLSPSVAAVDAEQIDRAYADARARSNEGVMLKAARSLYLPGRRGLLWVKLKRQLATLDVVITGAEFGSGRKAPFLSDYTFAVRGPAGPDSSAGTLLNVGKAYSGVTDAEISELTEWCKAHTLDDHGHFRTVEPQIVLEVAFNNIMRSERHASGFALRFPRIITIRRDKTVLDIDTLDRVEEVYQSQPDKPREGDEETTDSTPGERARKLSS